MHYHAEILIQTSVDVDQQIARIMAPHREAYNGGDTTGFWDWFQIGGRFTGVHDGYKPSEDLRNHEECDLCNGTGFRDDDTAKRLRADNPGFTCNGCSDHRAPKGRAVKWPTCWADHPGDIAPVKSIDPSLTCYTLIVGDDVFHEGEWDGKEWRKTGFNGNVKECMESLGVTSGYLVTVDYHR